MVHEDFKIFKASRELFVVDDLDRFKSSEVDRARAREETRGGYAGLPVSGLSHVEVMRFDPAESTDSRSRSGKCLARCNVNVYR